MNIPTPQSEQGACSEIAGRFICRCVLFLVAIVLIIMVAGYGVVDPAGDYMGCVNNCKANSKTGGERCSSLCLP